MLVCHPVVPLLKNHAVLKEKSGYTPNLKLIAAAAKTPVLPPGPKNVF